jgi:hypothetical protein
MSCLIPDSLLIAIRLRAVPRSQTEVIINDHAAENGRRCLKRGRRCRAKMRCQPTIFIRHGPSFTERNQRTVNGRDKRAEGRRSNGVRERNRTCGAISALCIRQGNNKSASFQPHIGRGNTIPGVDALAPCALAVGIAEQAASRQKPRVWC